MSFYNFIGLLVIVLITLTICHIFTYGDPSLRWSDIPTVAAVLFGVSPYGQACYRWVKEKLARRSR